MENLALTFWGIIIGVAATIVVGRYYFLRSFNKRLTPYIQIASPLLEGIDSTVRESLKIHYRGVEVLNLFQLEIVFINDGDRAIRDCLEPLSLHLPKGIKVLDAVVLDVHPEERVVTTKTREATNGSTTVPVIDFDFKLLNKGEYFRVKLLTDGLFNIEELKFYITADDLPPLITLKRPPSPLIPDFKEQNTMFNTRIAPAKIRFITGFVGILMAIIIAFAGLIIYRAKNEIRFMLPVSLDSSVPNILTTGIVLICGTFALGFLIMGCLSFLDVLQRTSRYRRPFAKERARAKVKN
jgi:hypothetical protein